MSGAFDQFASRLLPYRNVAPVFPPAPLGELGQQLAFIVFDFQLTEIEPDAIVS